MAAQAVKMQTNKVSWNTHHALSADMAADPERTRPTGQTAGKALNALVESDLLRIRV